MFTESDIKKILRTVTGGTNTNATHPSSVARSRLPNLPPSLESVSGGLILEKHARSVIEKAIFSDKQPSEFHSDTKGLMIGANANTCQTESHFSSWLRKQTSRLRMLNFSCHRKTDLNGAE